MDIQELIKRLNAFNEATVQEEILTDQTAPDIEIDVDVDNVMHNPDNISKPAFNDTMTLADTLDVKAKVAKALEVLKSAIIDFKNATSEKVDLLKDSELLQAIEQLDISAESIEQSLAKGSSILDNELNEPFKAQLPIATDDEKAEETEEAEIDFDTDVDEDKKSEDTEEEEDFDFGTDAALDLVSED